MPNNPNAIARSTIVELSLQFPNLRFGEFLDNACRVEYGYDSVQFVSDDIMLELCLNYAKKLKAKGTRGG